MPTDMKEWAASMSASPTRAGAVLIAVNGDATAAADYIERGILPSDKRQASACLRVDSERALGRRSTTLSETPMQYTYTTARAYLADYYTALAEAAS